MSIDYHQATPLYISTFPFLEREFLTSLLRRFLLQLRLYNVHEHVQVVLLLLYRLLQRVDIRPDVLDLPLVKLRRLWSCLPKWK